MTTRAALEQAEQALAGPQVSEEMVTAALLAHAGSYGRILDRRGRMRAALEAALSIGKEFATPALPVAEGETGGGESQSPPGFEAILGAASKHADYLDAFARGAAAMRESIAQSRDSAGRPAEAAAIRALPIPTEPKP